MGINICIQGKKVDTARAGRIAEKLGGEVISVPTEGEPYLLMDKTGIALINGKQELKGDFTKMLQRVTGGHLQHEILLKAAKLSGENMRAVDCTAGLGEDSFILSAGGFHVEMFEHNPITAVLLEDALLRARSNPQLKEITSRMNLRQGDSKELLGELNYSPDLIYLDPMYPEKKKNAESKKKLQVLHTIESPCSDEGELFSAAVSAEPKKIIVKRPPSAGFLADAEPAYSVTRKAVRFDVYVF